MFSYYGHCVIIIDNEQDRIFDIGTRWQTRRTSAVRRANNWLATGNRRTSGGRGACVDSCSPPRRSPTAGAWAGGVARCPIDLIINVSCEKPNASPTGWASAREHPTTNRTVGYAVVTLLLLLMSYLSSHKCAARPRNPSYTPCAKATRRGDA